MEAWSLTSGYTISRGGFESRVVRRYKFLIPDAYHPDATLT